MMPALRAFAFIAAVTSFVSVHAPTPASASIFCIPKSTRDGFVALRSGPGPETRLLGRMTPADEVQLLQDRRGKWVEAKWWRSDDRLAKPQQPPAGQGWVHRDLVDACG